jgi:hypothetical protein
MLINSKFDIVSVDNPVALAALAQILTVDDPPGLSSEGTPLAGEFPPGAIVEMNEDGKAVLATSPANVTADMALKKLLFVTIDGNTGFSGAFAQRLTVLAGGFTMLTDQFETGTYVPGAPVAVDEGKIVAMESPSTVQVYGFVGPAGLDATNGVLQVIVPQGAGL